MQPGRSASPHHPKVSAAAGSLNLNGKLASSRGGVKQILPASLAFKSARRNSDARLSSGDVLE
jgi:hypothetical protein